MKKLKIAIFISLLIVSLGNVVLSNAIGFEKKIHKNVYIREINLSDLTKEQAKNKIYRYIQNNNTFLLSSELQNKEYVFSTDQIDVDYNIDEIVEKAYSIGRDKDIISNIKTKGELSSGKKVILDYNITYNEKKLNKFLNELDKKIYKKPINASIKIRDNKIIITEERNGYKLNKDKLKDIIIGKILRIENKTVEIPIQKIKPLYTYDELSKINTVLGKFETYFNPKNYNRVNNISLAAKATDNILLKQGEIFSFNSNIKSSNINSYLKEAPIIINGKQEYGIGGGMCQVSTTIYNAALYSGMKIVNVRNHSIPSPYIEKGRDATISEGMIDLKFLNQYSTPIYIHNKIEDNKVVCTIYGNKNNNEDIEIMTEIVDVINNKMIIKTSEKYDLGIKSIEQEGRDGYKVKTYRIYKDNPDNKIEYIGESYYPPQDKIIIYGTKEIRK